MSDNIIFNAGARQAGLDRPAPTARPQGDPAQRGGRFPSKQTAAQQRDPLDLETAFNRLDKLLARDDGSPRSDAPARGYYLNILA